MKGCERQWVADLRGRLAYETCMYLPSNESIETGARVCDDVAVGNGGALRLRRGKLHNYARLPGDRGLAGLRLSLC